MERRNIGMEYPRSGLEQTIVQFYLIWCDNNLENILIFQRGFCGAHDTMSVGTGKSGRLFPSPIISNC